MKKKMLTAFGWGLTAMLWGKSVYADLIIPGGSTKTSASTDAISPTDSITSNFSVVLYGLIIGVILIVTILSVRVMDKKKIQSSWGS